MIERTRMQATWGGGFSMAFTTEVHAGQLVVKRHQIVSEYAPRVKVGTGPGLGPHFTDDPDALRQMAAQLQAAASLLERRQASHHDAKVAEGLWC